MTISALVNIVHGSSAPKIMENIPRKIGYLGEPDIDEIPDVIKHKSKSFYTPEQNEYRLLEKIKHEGEMKVWQLRNKSQTWFDCLTKLQRISKIAEWVESGKVITYYGKEGSRKNTLIIKWIGGQNEARL